MEVHANESGAIECLPTVRSFLVDILFDLIGV
jgi:hypothetical protein